MGQREYDDFKRRLREWMDSHSDEYVDFESAMNAKDDTGYRKILHAAVKLVPSYRKLLCSKANEGLFDHIDNIERFCEKQALAGKVVRGFDKADKSSLIPAMLCWLYFGPSFERMVERGEELRRSPGTGYLEKMMIAATIRLLVRRSVQLGLRTPQDWKMHREALHLADSGRVLEWAIEEDTGLSVSLEKKKAGRPSTAKPLLEMFSPIVPDPDALMAKLREYLTVKHSQTDIARLKIALDELHFLVSPVTVKSFRDALYRQFSPDIHIVHERGVQEAYSRLTDPLSGGTMPSGTNDDYWKLQELKKTLSR